MQPAATASELALIENVLTLPGRAARRLPAPDDPPARRVHRADLGLHRDGELVAGDRGVRPRVDRAPRCPPRARGSARRTDAREAPRRAREDAARPRAPPRPQADLPRH